MKIPMGCTIESLNKQDHISAVDVAFAEMIQRRFGQASPEISACLVWMMSQMRQGHTCVKVADLPYPDALPDNWIARENAPANKLFKQEKEWLYFHRYWHMETRLIGPLYERLNEKPNDSVECPTELLEGLNLEQAKAVQASLKYSFFILSGGPGTGKTHTAARIVAAHRSCQRIALVAPTGKAVSRLKQSICSSGLINDKCIESMTLHALLRVRNASDLVNPKQVISHELIIIDESSMMDILNSCLKTTKLILIGDPNQLPPIEVGHVFEELCAMKLHNMVTLKQCMRTDRLALINLAQAVCDGAINESLDYQKQMPSIESLVDQIPTEFKMGGSCKAEEYFEALKRFQILSALRQGSYGVDVLNEMIWGRIKSQATSQCIAVPVIVTKNAMDLGLSNGDIGIWIRYFDRLSQGNVFFQKDGEIQTISCALIPAFEIAYVISVHKSQGSEYGDVVLLLPPGCEKFGRKMIYTAITRARVSLTIASSSDTLQACIEANPIRQSGLRGRLACTGSFGSVSSA